MTSEDWKAVFQYIAKSDTITTVAPAFIAALSGIGASLAAGNSMQVSAGFGFMAFATVYLDSLRRKANTNDAKTDKAADLAEKAATKAEANDKSLTETKELLNGQLTEWKETLKREMEARIAEALAKGKMQGINSAASALAENPKVPVNAQVVAEVLASASHHD